MHWTLLTFRALTNDQLYDLLRLRSEVFVVEQNCVYGDLDGKDATALHLLGVSISGALTAYARILPPASDGLPIIGRVVIDPVERGSGTGHELMREALAAIERTYGSRRSKLEAQSHLERFYAAHGFVRHGADHLLDGIPHVDMVLSAPA
ncbi:MAG: GNAT family N-acetyltransferase [Flavobacteriales bacterium]|nr:GNAT family N-acetyltransferase [Flavobacteriales bacterium]